MKNKILYTCITNGYDDIPIHKYISNDWDYVLFTDNETLLLLGQVNQWKIQPLRFNKLTNVKNARWHKVNAHKLFANYRYSLWVDGNISIQNEHPFHRIDKLIDEDVKVSISPHPKRNCVYDEAEVIKEHSIDLPEIVDEEMAYLRKNNYPAENGLAATYVMFRQHNDQKVRCALIDWWSMIDKFSKRDQLSCDYAFWKNNVEIYPLYDLPTTPCRHEDYVFSYPATHDRYYKKDPKRKSQPRRQSIMVRKLSCLIKTTRIRLSLVINRGLKNIKLITKKKYLKRTARYTQDYLMISSSAYFDRAYYLHTYPDVAQARLDPISHYLTHGWQENRNPSDLFNTACYIRYCGDQEAASMPALLHYEKYRR